MCWKPWSRLPQIFLWIFNNIFWSLKKWKFMQAHKLLKSHLKIQKGAPHKFLLHQSRIFQIPLNNNDYILLACAVAACGWREEKKLKITRLYFNKCTYLLHRSLFIHSFSYSALSFHVSTYFFFFFFLFPFNHIACANFHMTKCV